MYKKIIKSVIDWITAFTILVLVSPLLVVIALMLYMNNRGEMFFIQERIGKDEKIIRVLKFKTMNDKRDNQGNLLPDGKRLTNIGKFVRSTSIDEVPQLINVLLGQMSLIGPRPLLVKYLPYYTATERNRHRVKPGITGWAQVNGRNMLNWDDRLALDVWYVKHLSFKLDAKIMILTVSKVLKRDDIIVNVENLEFKNLDEERRN
jgi:undecaprenyl phosphate N,N'-diacetylbacillosamine 1-phosphate transferase